MYSLKIEFITEEEEVSFAKEGFNTSEEAANFAIDFLKTYIEKYKIADGTWTIFDPENPHVTERHYRIKSLRSLRAEESASRI